MDIVSVIKLVFGGAGVLGILGLGLLGLSKFRNSKLRSDFDKVSGQVSDDKEKVHEIEVSVAQKEQQKVDVQAQEAQVDKQLDKASKEPPKEGSTEAVLEMFDKLSRS